MLGSSNREPSPLKPGRYAAIDIGTVTCRILIADVDDAGQVEVVHREMAICDLGEGVDESHRLRPDAIERVGVAVEGFMRVVRECEGRDRCSIPVMAVATSASRDARNADELQRRIEQAGVDLQVISGSREAALSFAGASSAFGDEHVVIIDVGGGSTEMIAGRAGSEPLFSRSFDIGCRRVTERFLHCNPVPASALEEARAWIAGEMRSYIDGLREAGCFRERMVAVAGTATSCVSMRERMSCYDPERVHGAMVACGEVDELVTRLAAMPLSQRERVVGLEPRRAPVIVAGLLILQVAMELAQVDCFTVSELDILHGIIYDLASR